MEATLAPVNSPQRVIADLVKELVRRDQKFQRSKRASLRYSLNCAVKLGIPGEGGSVKPLCDAWGVDLSLNGIGLLALQELLPGRDVSLGLQGLAGTPGWMTIRIIYSQCLVGTMVRLGGAFVFPGPTAPRGV